MPHLFSCSFEVKITCTSDCISITQSINTQQSQSGYSPGVIHVAPIVSENIRRRSVSGNLSLSCRPRTSVSIGFEKSIPLSSVSFLRPRTELENTLQALPKALLLGLCPTPSTPSSRVSIVVGIKPLSVLRFEPIVWGKATRRNLPPDGTNAYHARLSTGTVATRVSIHRTLCRALFRPIVVHVGRSTMLADRLSDRIASVERNLP
ncbi:hypothetical protein M427DRAFT_477731 [Gonapodya prolifera JEL478]|uniref:Uncharacterized protein n=1 Tax=Gonapodya prolifera (strain JEL478) TaxID=1344416 RepID=A0A139A175_GONPJ|nr:hypothetical protein M427DRAFT_477731 [Gonapodya prolifera JEL478]|eukprot:KXS10521.1 hypothetical protein M427DRAFT_477731 [Gonapodya prolifera JEL478]